VVEDVRGEAERLSGASQPVRPLLKRARLPRLGKALAA
ncbi:MAG: PIN domain-containing protein, partial [Jannaschia sp.]